MCAGRTEQVVHEPRRINPPGAAARKQRRQAQAPPAHPPVQGALLVGVGQRTIDGVRAVASVSAAGRAEQGSSHCIMTHGRWILVATCR